MLRTVAGCSKKTARVHNFNRPRTSSGIGRLRGLCQPLQQQKPVTQQITGLLHYIDAALIGLVSTSQPGTLARHSNAVSRYQPSTLDKHSGLQGLANSRSRNAKAHPSLRTDWLGGLSQSLWKQGCRLVPVVTPTYPRHRLAPPCEGGPDRIGQHLAVRHFSET